VNQPGKTPTDTTDEGEGASESGVIAGTRKTFTSGLVRLRGASERHVSIAVPFRAAERNQRVASSVLAGGVAYRFFLWLLPFGLIIGGALGLGDADSIENALADGGMAAGVVAAIGDAARASDSAGWWPLAVGVPLLLWAGYTGAKAMQLIHALVWNEVPPRTAPLKASLEFTGVSSAFMVAVALTWWFQDSSWSVALVVPIVAFVPLAAIWLWASLQLPHGNASWKSLLPGAVLVAIGFQVLHGVVVDFLVPKLEKSTSYYGNLGVIATFLFFMYFAGRLVVTAPILNSSLHEELRKQSPPNGDDGQAGVRAISLG
jgi:uncharacterized BrkB/YihY/UPF0761 family membrane protein